MASSSPDPVQLAFADVENELDKTRTTLERIPEDKLDWRPHPRSWTLGEMAMHIATLPMWLRTSLETEELDLTTLPPRGEPPTTTAEILQAFDDKRAELAPVLESVQAETLGEPWTLRQGDEVLFRMPRHLVFRSMGVSHIVHHRAQLTMYLRMLDVPIPGLYGPSADEGLA